MASARTLIVPSLLLLVLALQCHAFFPWFRYQFKIDKMEEPTTPTTPTTPSTPTTPTTPSTPSTPTAPPPPPTRLPFFAENLNTHFPPFSVELLIQLIQQLMQLLQQFMQAPAPSK